MIVSRHIASSKAPPFYVCEEARAADRAVEDAWRGDAVVAQSGQKRQGFPVAVWHKCLQAFAFGFPSAQRRHVGLRPCLINKDETARINYVLILVPPIFAPHDIRAGMLSSMNRFF